MLARLMKSIGSGGDPSIVARVQAARLTFLEESALRESWLGKSAQWDKWSFCLTAAKMAAEQERQ